MTFFGLLAGGQVTTPAPDPEPAPVTALNLTYSDATSDAARPEWRHIIHVGPARAITTVEDGVLAATRTGYAQPDAIPSAGSFGAPARGGRPVHARTLVLLDPGTYTLTKINDAGYGIDIMGNGDARDDVVIRTNGTADVRYALRMWGTIHVSNLTLKLESGAAGNNYPAHGSDPGGPQHHTAIFDNVRFVDNNPSAYGIVGWDMPSGMRAYHYRCRFESTTGHGVIYHDMPNNVNGVEAYWIDCEADADLSIGYTATPKRGRWVTSGCTTLDGTPVPDREAVDGAAPAAFSGPAPTMPAEGITEADRAKYLPLAAPGAVIAPLAGARSTFTPVDDRTYYIPVGLPPEAALVKSVRLAVANAGAGVSCNLYVGTSARPTAPVQWNAYKTATGDVEFAQAGKVSFLERDPVVQFWIGVRCKGGAQIEGAPAPAGVVYEDGGTDWNGAKLWPTSTPTTVAQGEMVPAPVIVAQ